jgi:hypothetical protein
MFVRNIVAKIPSTVILLFSNPMEFPAEVFVAIFVFALLDELTEVETPLDVFVEAAAVVATRVEVLTDVFADVTDVVVPIVGVDCLVVEGWATNTEESVSRKGYLGIPGEEPYE